MLVHSGACGCGCQQLHPRIHQVHRGVQAVKQVGTRQGVTLQGGELGACRQEGGGGVGGRPAIGSAAEA